MVTTSPPKEDLRFDTDELLQITDLPLGRLKEFLRLGYIKPADPSQGKRDKNLYDFKNAMEVKTVMRMAHYGLRRGYIEPISFAVDSQDRYLTQDPFSLTQFLPTRKTVSSILVNFQPVFLKFVHYQTFYKIGFEYHFNDRAPDFVAGLYRARKKNIQIKDLTIAEKKRWDLGDNLQDLNFSLNLTTIHFEVRSKLVSMGLI